MLQEADFSYCIEITIQGVDHILSKCVWLEKLCLSKCSGLSELQPLDTSLKQESYTGNPRPTKTSNLVRFVKYVSTIHRLFRYNRDEVDVGLLVRAFLENLNC
jgi:hypothetical protein